MENTTKVFDVINGVIYVETTLTGYRVEKFDANGVSVRARSVENVIQVNKLIQAWNN